MSKKKRERKAQRQGIEFAEENLQRMKDKVLSFLENSSPFKISCELAKHGIITTHRQGIFDLLDSNFMKTGLEKEKLSKMRDSNQVLAFAWRREIESKGKELSAEDMVFLMVAAARFALQWAEFRLALSQARMAALETENSKRDQNSVNA